MNLWWQPKENECVETKYISFKFTLVFVYKGNCIINIIILNSKAFNTVASYLHFMFCLLVSYIKKIILFNLHLLPQYCLKEKVGIRFLDIIQDQTTIIPFWFDI